MHPQKASALRSGKDIPFPGAETAGRMPGGVALRSLLPGQRRLEEHRLVEKVFREIDVHDIGEEELEEDEEEGHIQHVAHRIFQRF